MDNDLNRSVRLLEDALSSSGRGLFKKTLGQSRIEDKAASLSMTVSNYEMQKLLMRDSTSLYEKTFADILQGDQTLSGNVLQSNILPWKTAIDSLYTEFFEVLQNHAGKHKHIYLRNCLLLFVF